MPGRGPGLHDPGFPRGARELERPRSYYDAIYSRDLKEKSGYYRPWRAQTGKIVWYPALLFAEPPILDVGCGCGHFAAMCKEYGIEYVAGLDYSGPAIKIAHIQAPDAEFVQGSALASPRLEGDDYKTAVILEVLEHVYKDLELLRRIPSGRIVVTSVPSFGRKTAGHVRWFNDVAEVKQRYRSVLQIETIVSDHGPGSANNRFYILKGVRR